MELFKRRRARPSDEMLIRDCLFVVLDTELTGLDERCDSIISIGAMKMKGGRIDLSNCFSRMIKPEAAMGRQGILVHGITPAELEEKPDASAVLSEFSAYCLGSILVGYCLSIDLTFLNRQLKQCPDGAMKNPAVDICRIYEWLRNRKMKISGGTQDLPELGRDGLYQMSGYFGVPVSGAHNALSDAFIAAQIFQRMIPILVTREMVTVSDLLRISDPGRRLGSFDRGSANDYFQM